MQILPPFPVVIIALMPIMFCVISVSSISNNVCFSQGNVRTALCDGFESSGRKNEGYVLASFGYVDFSALKISLSTYFAAGVKLRCARAV